MKAQMKEELLLCSNINQCAQPFIPHPSLVKPTPINKYLSKILSTLYVMKGREGQGERKSTIQNQI